MSNKTLVIIGIVIVIVLIIIGVVIYQSQVNRSKELDQQKYLIFGSTITSSLQQGNQGGWWQNLLNSSSVTSLAGGFASGLSSNYGQQK